jgi:hypothetical protein
MTGKKLYSPFSRNFIMSENIQKSPSLNQMVDAFALLKQRLEYFERHVQNSKGQEVRKEYFRTLAQVIEAENALRNFVKVFYNDKWYWDKKFLTQCTWLVIGMPDGTWMIVEPFANGKLEDNLNPVGHLFYPTSSLVCVPASLASKGQH